MNKSPDSQPDWSKLPNNPAAFFELPAGFDRKALKRKYNKLIRQFKPEKFPGEFQKIRAAYELLDGQLRYGEAPKVSEGLQFQWEQVQNDTLVEPPPALAELVGAENNESLLEPLDEIEAEIPLYQRIETESPQAIFKEFKERTGKTPYDYFAMALISDVVSDDPLMFFKLVLTGIQKHNFEPGLMNILYEYLQQEVELPQIPVILKTVSKVVRNQQFYFLTEKLWGEFLRKADFQLWAQTLENCESNLKEFRIEGQLAFYIHIMPAAIFKADGKWLKSKAEFLKSHGNEVPMSLEMDFEMVHQLLDYRRSLAKDEVYSQEIHQAISEYYMLGDRKGDEAVIALQNSFTQNPGILLDSYELDAPYNESQIVLWNFVNEDICQRKDLYSQMEPRELRAKIFDLLDDLNQSEIDRFNWFDEIRYYGIQYVPYVVALATPYIVLSAWFSGVTMVIATILAIAGWIGVKYWYRPDEKFEAYIEKKMKRRYMADWRYRFVHLFESLQIDHYHISDALVDIVENHGDKVGFAAWIVRFLPADLGLHLFASATKFSR